MHCRGTRNILKRSIVSRSASKKKHIVSFAVKLITLIRTVRYRNAEGSGSNTEKLAFYETMSIFSHSRTAMQTL